jgi:hypothetical protein
MAQVVGHLRPWAQSLVLQIIKILKRKENVVTNQKVDFVSVCTQGKTKYTTTYK